jgi:hypothetical protein
MPTIYLNDEDYIDITEDESDSFSGRLININKSFLISLFKFASSTTYIFDSESKIEAVFEVFQNYNKQENIIEKFNSILTLIENVKKFDKLSYYNEILVKRNDIFEYTKKLHEFVKNISALYNNVNEFNNILKEHSNEITLKLITNYNSILLISEDDKKCYYKNNDELSFEKEKYQIVNLLITELSTLLTEIENKLTITKLPNIISILEN